MLTQIAYLDKDVPKKALVNLNEIVFIQENIETNALRISLSTGRYFLDVTVPTLSNIPKQDLIRIEQFNSEFVLYVDPSLITSVDEVNDRLVVHIKLSDTYVREVVTTTYTFDEFIELVG